MTKEKVTRLQHPADINAAKYGKEFNPSISNTPALPAIDWTLIGLTAPQMLTTPAGSLPHADAVVITWASAEWAALEHVFCTSNQTMTYSKRETSTWPGWEKYTHSIPHTSQPDWNYWGYYRLVQVGSQKVLLFKSNTHLDYPGAQYLAQLINLIITNVKPKLILSIGTAGGGRPTDHIGTINVVNAGTLFAAGQPQADWKNFANNWHPNWTAISNPKFKQLLFPVPSTKADITSLIEQFNKYHGSSYTAAQLNPNNLNMGDLEPAINNLTVDGTALLTTPTFVVATTAGNLGSFACVEMDDAIIAEVCKQAGTPFGFVRNISDPVQNVALPSEVQGNWGSAIYESYGFYTSYNGALTACAILGA